VQLQREPMPSGSAVIQQAPELEKKLILAGFNTQLRRGDSTDPIPALFSLTDAFRNRVDLLVGLRGLEAAAFSNCAVWQPDTAETPLSLSKKCWLAGRLRLEITGAMP
jgi:hypothetical protein